MNYPDKSETDISVLGKRSLDKFLRAIDTVENAYRQQCEMLDYTDGGPLDVATGGFFTNLSLLCHPGRIIDIWKAGNQFEKVKKICDELRKHAAEYDVSLTHASLGEKIRFRVRFLHVISGFISQEKIKYGYTEYDLLYLSRAFEDFLSARKQIDLSHF